MTARDPVCGMNVDPERARGGSFEHEGHQYFFCNPKCRERFIAEPSRFLSASTDAPAAAATPVAAKIPAAPTTPMVPEAPAAASPNTVWVCPMDPEVRESKPGPCPKCGMALEPEVASAEHDDSELRDMSRRLKDAAGFTIPLLIIAMSEMVPATRVSSWPGRGYLELAAATRVCLWDGLPFFERAWASLKNRSLNMFTLIGIGVGVAYLYSVVALLAPGLFPASFRGHHGELGLYFEAAAVIVALALLGQVLELRARRQTGDAIGKLLDLAPRSAQRVTADGREEQVRLESVRVGDRLRIRPGDRLPVDGIVLEGASHVDESMVSGEPLAVGKKPGDPLTGGTLNGTGSLLMRVQKVGADTLVSRIVALVSEARRSRAPIQKLVDRVAAYFVPAVLAIALLTFAAWSAFGPEPRVAHALVNAVAVLIVACPCALGLATPMSILVATGKGATAGVLFKNAEAIELLSKVDTLVIDKTGTLTEGKPQLTRLLCAAGVEETALLRWAASLEGKSEHPLARAVLEAAAQRGVQPAEVSDFESLTGQGVQGSVEGQQVVLGNHTLLERTCTDLALLEPLTATASELQAKGQTVVFLSVAGKPAGALAISDPLKSGSAAAIRALHAEGLRIVMLTGDTHATAQAVAAELGITEVIAGVLPDQKADAIARLQHAGRVVAMAGDGINDAPALARANVGIAMATGTDIAIESAGVTLLKGDLGGIVRARTISRLTLSNIRQNLYFAFGYNSLGIPIAAGVLYPTFGLLLSPMLAAAAMSLSSVSVIANALRLRRAAL